ncbi:hypothetical protein FRC11_009646, partial [Ceratobasidium sp. 423]
MSIAWQNFKQVERGVPSGGRIFRSSAPFYGGYDEPQVLDQDAVGHLVRNGINMILSLNGQPYTLEAQALLSAARIAYHHMPVPDFTTPTREIFNSAFQLASQSAGLLVHCGAGHGRTGTVITAIQLLTSSGAAIPESHLWQSENHVETAGQIGSLRALRDELLF